MCAPLTKLVVSAHIHEAAYECLRNDLRSFLSSSPFKASIFVPKSRNFAGKVPVFALQTSLRSTAIPAGPTASKPAMLELAAAPKWRALCGRVFICAARRACARLQYL